MPRSATPRARELTATHMGTGFAGGLPRCARCEGGRHSLPRTPCIPSRKTGCAAMWDLIRGSLESIDSVGFFALLYDSWHQYAGGGDEDIASG